MSASRRLNRDQVMEISKLISRECQKNRHVKWTLKLRRDGTDVHAVSEVTVNCQMMSS